MARMAINGMGRIGRASLKVILENEHMELVAVNDLAPIGDVAYLLGSDTVYGKYDKAIKTEKNALMVGDHERIEYLSEKDPSKLPWRNMSIDIVIECTGALKTKADLQKHIDAGAQHVILSTTTKEDMPTIVFGVNLPSPGDRIISTASCTTNCMAPVVEIVGRRIGFQKCAMTTVHAYTSSQKIVDSVSGARRRGRAGALNIVPTTTGAAVATTKAVPEYAGKFDGRALRVPVPVGSISDMTFLTSRVTTEEEVNFIFSEEAGTERYMNIVGVASDDFVSSDIIRDSRASVIDRELTQVIDGDMLKVMSWYDNEWGYTNQMIRTAAYMALHMTPAATST